MMHDVHQYVIAAGIGAGKQDMLHTLGRIPFIRMPSVCAVTWVGCVCWVCGSSGRPNWLIYMLCHARLARQYSHWHGMPTDRPGLKASVLTPMSSVAYRIARVASQAHNEAAGWGGNSVQDLGGDESRIKYQFRLSVRLFRCPLSFIRQPHSASHQIANNFLYYKTACMCACVCVCYVLQLPAAACVVA